MRNFITVNELNNKLNEFNKKYGTSTDWMILYTIYDISPSELPSEVKEYFDKVKDLEIK